MAKQHSIEIDPIHTLENFRDAYDDESTIVVLEAIANALDAKADRIDITLNNGKIRFMDNGPGMNRRQFKAYHKISGSSKTKGRSIGFAGVGAKIYLAVWKNTKIHTETFGDDGPLASDMHVIHGRLKWSESDTSTSIRTRDTSYEVALREKDYETLQSKIHNTILDTFNPAMTNGLTVIISGTRLEPWNPQHVFQTHGTVKSKNLQFPITLSVMRDAIPSRYRHIQYEVWGKVVTTKRPDWAADVGEQYKNCVHAVVNAEKCSKHLKLNKNSFKTGQVRVADMYRSVERWMHETLRKNGYIERQEGEVRQSAKLTRFFQTLFKKPEYEWLNPNAANGRGPASGTGQGDMANDRGSTEQTERPDSHDTAQDEQSEKENTERRNDKNGKKTGSGLNITLVDRDDVMWDGRLDPETNNFICNKRHPLYRKYEKNEDARNQRVKSILFSELIKNGSKRHSITANDAFIIHRDLMTEAKDLKVV